MKSSLRSTNIPRCTTVAFLLLFSILTPPTNVYAGVDMNLTAPEWKKLLTGTRGGDPCGLKDWLASPVCQNGTDDADGNTRSASGDLSPSRCKCTVPYFNILCGCLLSNGSSDVISTLDYAKWKQDCDGGGFPTNQSTLWLDNQGHDIPEWAYITPNALTFDSARVLKVVDLPTRWSTIQIVVPVVTVISTLALLGIVYLFVHHRRGWKVKNHHGRPFFAFVRKILIRRSPSVRHPGRNETWQIEDHGRERFDSDSESFFMVPNPPNLVQSPIEEFSYWSPATDTRQPSRLNQSADHRMPYTSTVRNIRNRVRNLMPWTTLPHPVTNIRPGSRYRIDGDSGSVKTRSNTTSTIATSRKQYRTIPGADEEYAKIMGSVGKKATAGRGQGAGAEVTTEDRAAVADSVILIGDRDFTLESGSSGHNSSHPKISSKNSASVAYARGHGIEGLLKSPDSARPDVHVEPPSPTLDLHPVRAIPISPGAPPLLPPPPQERPPLPPISERNTPRRTPSPHLQILTGFESRNVSKNTLNGTADTHQRDPSISSGTHALSYVTSSPQARPQPLPSFVTIRNAGAHSTRVPNPSDGLGSGSGSRPLPNIDERSISPSRYLPQPQNEFDPYEGISPSHTPRPRPLSDMDMVYLPNRHKHNSSVSLPRSPGEPEGQPQRGWSADDEMDRASLLIDQQPMQIDNGMSGVYIATPRDVRVLGGPGEGPRHWTNPSAESIASVVSLGNSVERQGGNGEHSRLRNGLPSEPESPTLSVLEKDPRSRAAFATFAGRGSLSGSSGWDSSTQGHGMGMGSIPSPINRPPLPTQNSQQRTSPIINIDSVETPSHDHHSSGNHSFSSTGLANRSTSPNLGHRRDLSITDSSRSTNRSRENIVSPPRNDPVRLFPDSVRAAGYTIGLGPDAVPVPPRSPRQNEFGNINAGSNPSVSNGTHRRSESRGIRDNDADDQYRGRASTSGVTGSGPLAGYIERDRAQQSGGGTWGTDSSGVETIFEAVQQLPEPLNAHLERTAISLRTESRTPPG